MRFTAWFGLALAAVGCVSAANITTVKQDIADIDKQTQAIYTALQQTEFLDNQFDQIFAISDSAKALAKKLNGTAKDVKSLSKGASTASSQAILKTLNGTEKTVSKIAARLIALHSNAYYTGVTDIVSSDIASLSKSTTLLGNALIAKAASGTKNDAKKLLVKFIKDLASVTKTYSKPPASDSGTVKCTPKLRGVLRFGETDQGILHPALTNENSRIKDPVDNLTSPYLFSTDSFTADSDYFTFEACESKFMNLNSTDDIMYGHITHPFKDGTRCLTTVLTDLTLPPGGQPMQTGFPNTTVTLSNECYHDDATQEQRFFSAVFYPAQGYWLVHFQGWVHASYRVYGKNKYDEPPADFYYRDTDYGPVIFGTNAGLPAHDRKRGHEKRQNGHDATGSTLTLLGQAI